MVPPTQPARLPLPSSPPANLSLTASLLAHPLSLAALLVLLAAWCLLYLLRPVDAPPLAACGHAFSDRETLVGLIATSAFAVFLTSVGSLIFFALALGAAVVYAHGAFRVPEDLFLDEPNQASSGGPINLLSITWWCHFLRQHSLLLLHALTDARRLHASPSDCP